MISAPPCYDVRTIDADAWDVMLAQFPDRTVFHMLAWLRTIAGANRLKMALTGAFDNEECVGLWPYLEMRKGPLRIIGSPLPGWSTAYLGPVLSPSVDSAAVVAAFLASRYFTRYAYFACRVMHGSQNIDLLPFGFSIVTQFDTYRIDLSQPEGMIWSNLKGECRTRIRKAEKSGLEVREETTAEFIDEFWQMAVETFARAKIQPTHNRAFLEELWSNLKPRGAVHVISAFHGGQRMASLVLPFDDRVMYYWNGVRFLKFANVPAHNLLHWRAICHARSLGLREYDFVSTRGGPGEFKKTFGPRQVHIATHWERSPSRILRSLKNRYERLLRARRRVGS